MALSLPHSKMSLQGQLGAGTQRQAQGHWFQVQGISCGDTSSVLRTCCWDEPGQLGRCCFPQTPLVAAGLTTERLASPMEGVAPALHTASSPWHTDMAAVRLDGCVAPLTSVRPLPQAAAATSQKKVKETVTQKSWEEQRDRKYSHTP